MTDRSKQAGAADYKAATATNPDEQTGERLPTPDPKDQTGDPDADNPAMRELHKRQTQRDITES